MYYYLVQGLMVCCGLNVKYPCPTAVWTLVSQQVVLFWKVVEPLRGKVLLEKVGPWGKGGLWGLVLALFPDRSVSWSTEMWTSSLTCLLPQTQSIQTPRLPFYGGLHPLIQWARKSPATLPSFLVTREVPSTVHAWQWPMVSAGFLLLSVRVEGVWSVWAWAFEWGKTYNFRFHRLHLLVICFVWVHLTPLLISFNVEILVVFF